MKQEIIKEPGPLVRLQCERLFKMLTIRNLISIARGDEQVITITVEEGTVEIRLRFTPS